MGSCCFTPRRTQFLWWYWLLLASIVGIPMFLACWYVARHQAADEATKRLLGKRAAGIFWAGAIASAIVACGACWRIHTWTLTKNPSGAVGWDGPPHFELFYLIISITGYLGGVAVLTTAGKPRPKLGVPLLSWLTLVALSGVILALLSPIHPGILMAIAGGLAVWIIARLVNAWKKDSPLARYLIYVPFMGFLFVATVSSSASLAEVLSLVAVCALTAHFFVQFSVNPTPRCAKHALIALVAGAFLFWGAVKYARVANLWAYSLVRGRVPDSGETYRHMENLE
jgi:hypothetical protein